MTMIDETRATGYLDLFDQIELKRIQFEGWSIGDNGFNKQRNATRVLLGQEEKRKIEGFAQNPIEGALLLCDLPVEFVEDESRIGFCE